MKTVTRAVLLVEARTWLNTPYRHQGRIKGDAVDCIGLVIGVTRALGIMDVHVSGYDRRPDGTLKDRVDTYLEPVSLHSAQPGDVLLFGIEHRPAHVGILTENGHLIHAFATNRKVVEHVLDDRWRGMVIAAYRIPGVV